MIRTAPSPPRFLVYPALVWSCLMMPIDTPMAAEPGENLCAFTSFTNFTEFTRSAGASEQAWVLTSPELAAPFDWNELVVSWNVVSTQMLGLQIEARATAGDRRTKFFNLGCWSLDPTQFPRHSVKQQKDEDGDVDTDTLILRQPARKYQLRLTLSGAVSSPALPLRFLGVSLLNTQARLPHREPNRAAWDKTLPVPERSQLAHADGDEWCSPTCVSMVLAHWAAVLRRPELDIPVARAAEAIHDPHWRGTGNWPFNTAFAGSFPGIRAYVTRVRSLRDIEDWIAAGVPPVLSVSSDVLHGKDKDEGNGHLIVCLGFTATGDVVANDPWARLEKGESVRRVYPRETVLKSWVRSRSAAYFIYPDTLKVPPWPAEREF